jgi:hypothetical protein
MKIWLSSKTYLPYGLITLITGSVILMTLFIIAPSNSRDNRDATKQAEMMEITLEWGRLAPFPTKAENVSIRTEGNQFTRSFRAKFNAPKEEIDKWIEVSPGLNEAKVEGMADGKRKYIISPGGGANYAEVIIDFKVKEVEVYVSWS